MNTAPFSIGDALRFGFRAFKNNFWLLIGISCIGFANNLGMHLVTAIVGRQVIGIKKVEVVETAEQPTQTRAVVDLEDESNVATKLIGLLLLLCVWFVYYIISLFLIMGWNQIGLDIYATGTSSFSRLWVPMPKIFTFYLTAILYTVIVAGGTLLLIIPGIIWAIKYGFADLIVVDSNHRALEALKASDKLTYGYKWNLLFFAFIAIMIACASVITIIGPIILSYVMFLSRVYIFKKLQEQWQTQHEPPTPFMP
jgi:uncharacterized membrane protein